MTTDKIPESVLKRYFMYAVSLPERTLRSGVGLVGGAAREAAALLIPQAFQDSKTYHVMVRQTLDFLVQDVGGVSAEATNAPPSVENFVARKAVGNFVDTASLLVFHVSPLAVLAIVSDVAYGSRAYLQEVGAELKANGIIDEDSTIHHVDDLLAAVAKASEHSATAFNTPPLSLEGLRKTVQDARDAVSGANPAKVIPQAELRRMWEEIRTTARQEDVSMLAVSGTMAMHALNRVGNAGRGAVTGVRVAGNLFERHVIRHYVEALAEIRKNGLFVTLRDVSEPYIDAVWNNFSHDKPTVTEDALTGRLFSRAWHKVCGFVNAPRNTPTDAPLSATSSAPAPMDCAVADAATSAADNSKAPGNAAPPTAPRDDSAPQ